MILLMQRLYVKPHSGRKCIFFQPRTEVQQAMRALHLVRGPLIRDKVKTTNPIHDSILEFALIFN